MELRKEEIKLPPLFTECRSEYEEFSVSHHPFQWWDLRAESFHGGA